MLIITRTAGESIVIGGNLRVTLLKIKGKTIELRLEDLVDMKKFPNLSAIEDQKVQIGKGVNILVVKVRGKQVRLGIDFPAEIEVLRGELYEKGNPGR